MLSSEEESLLNELKIKNKLTPTEKAKLKNLERKVKIELKETNSEKKKGNVFAIKSTTKVSPLPIRFLEPERTGLKTLADDIISDSLHEVITELGDKREINETKLIRAAVYLLKERSHTEIIKAIKDIKLQMLR